VSSTHGRKIPTHELSGLELYLQCRQFHHPRQKMLLWKFYRMAWTAHVDTDAPAPSWVVHPARITSLHPQLTEHTPVMVQALGNQKDVSVDRITTTVHDHIIAKWKRRGVCPWPSGDQFSEPSGSPRAGSQHPGIACLPVLLVAVIIRCAITPTSRVCSALHAPRPPRGDGHL